MGLLSDRGREARIVLEKQRQDLKRDQPALYAYIANREVAKEMDVLGHRLCDFSLRSANVAWRRAAAACSDNDELIAVLTSDGGSDAAQ